MSNLHLRIQKCFVATVVASSVLAFGAVSARAQDAFQDPGDSFATPPTQASHDQMPINNSQRELVLPRGFVRADLGLTLGDWAFGGRSDIYFWHDLGLSVGLFDGFEVGLTANRPGFRPRVAAGALTLGSDGDDFHYGRLVLYGRYQFIRSDHVLIAADLEFGFPTGSNRQGVARGGDFGMRAWVPIRIRMENIALDLGATIEFVTDPGQANFYVPFIMTLNLAERFYLRGGVSFEIYDLFDTDDDFALLHFFFGGGYTADIEGHPVDIGGEFGFPAMVISRSSDRTEGGVWYFRVNAALHYDLF